MLKSQTRLVATVALLALNWMMCASALNIDALMPEVTPMTKDTYLCTQFKLDEETPVYITEFQPKSAKEIAHHMLLFGCEEPSDEQLWNCGEMTSKTKTQQYKKGPVCKGKQSIIYAWAMDAPKLVLPKDVAFKLGGHTKIKYLVLQVHYANVDAFKDEGHKDSSGIILVGQKEPVRNRAGVYLLASGGSIKARTIDNFEAACEMTEDVVMHPFAYRTHTHQLGVVNSGYVIKTDASGEQHWTEVGRRSPQLPQMFFPASNNVTIERGDILAARCTMENLRRKTVRVGPTSDDEMCNFYIMYYVDGEQLVRGDTCNSYGPPYWYFGNFMSSKGDRLDMTKVPAEASSVPESQAVEMSDLESPHNMHSMHKMKVVEPKDDDSSDESEDERELLSQLRREYMLKQLLDNFDEQ